jgi:hypothetical protein
MLAHIKLKRQLKKKASTVRNHQEDPTMVLIPTLLIRFDFDTCKSSKD